MLKLSVIGKETDNNKKKAIEVLIICLGFITVLFIIWMKSSIVFNDSLYKFKINAIGGKYLFLIVSAGFLLFFIHRDLFYSKKVEKEEYDMENVYLGDLSSSLEYIILNIKKEKVLISEKLADIIGYNGKGFISYVDYCKAYIHPDDFEEARISLDKDIGDFTISNLTAKYRLKKFNSKYEWIQSRRIVVTDDDGNPVKIIEVYQNINEIVEYYKKRLKTSQMNVKQKESAKTDFLNYICHEFKMPLNIILGVIQLMELIGKNDEETYIISVEKLNRYIKIMKQNAYRQIRLINNMLDITKIDNNYLMLDLSNENIVKVVKDVVLSVNEFINNKNIKLTFNTEIKEKIIACDKDKIERVVLNLLSNAIKYTDSGGEIYVNIWEEKGDVFLLVGDTGIGIPDDMQKDIFDIYKQVNFRRKREKQGTGIGLSLVKSIIDLHSGRIWVESEVNKGSKFFIKLPGKTLDDIYAREEAKQNSNGMVEKINIEFSDIYSF